jgi:site-specific recombinase XerD
VDESVTDAEAGYIRAANTLRGYRSDWAEFSAWCRDHRRDPIPASATTIANYLTPLAGLGAKVSTISRRLSAIKFAYQLRNLPDPTAQARVVRFGKASAVPTALPPTRPPRWVCCIDE